MDLFTAFLDILTTLLLCITLSMLSAMAAQILYARWYKNRSRKRRIFYHRKRQEAEFQKRGQILNKLIGDYKLIRTEKEHLLTENEALRRELKLHGEIRADMMSYSIRLESDNFDLRSRLNKAIRNIVAYKNELSDLASKEKARLEEECFVELETDADAVIQAKGLNFEELEDLPRIMQGINGTSDVEAAATVAKANGTVLFEQLQEQIKDSKIHISSLIDRLEEQMNSSNRKQKETEDFFYQQTGFSIRDFLPHKTA